MTLTEELPAGEAIERIIQLLNEAERLRITHNHEAANAATLGEPADWDKARSIQQRVSQLKNQFEKAATPFIILAQSYDIDSSPLDDFIRTGDDALVSGAIRVLRQVQGHILRTHLNTTSASRGGDVNHTGSQSSQSEAPASCAQLAEKHGIGKDALRKRLNRERTNNHGCYIEIDDTERGPREDKYLYRPNAVQHIIDDMLKKQTSSERPAR